VWAHAAQPAALWLLLLRSTHAWRQHDLHLLYISCYAVESPQRCLLG
jgi:hypothetical protein